ncbi:hypothetical protein PRIPAC_87263 [Pristionchus pacificus]|uniref:Uncharacterized protein n=1 Tax=Pristionchus pacificus TaxID=54126 RepID=A0A2A6B759_PRIPA|nr:hypothetical protein PRIPAC_87263 [Pristionchus pacificus]|eukprot:PDM61707.1 hypothetical protein PRIPAC_51149 [Pristionchus pacificus]
MSVIVQPTVDAATLQEIGTKDQRSIALPHHLQHRVVDTAEDVVVGVDVGQLESKRGMRNWGAWGVGGAAEVGKVNRGVLNVKGGKRESPIMR